MPDLSGNHAMSTPAASLESEHAPPPARLHRGWKRHGAIGVVSPGYGMQKVSYGVGPGGYTFHKVTQLGLRRLDRRGTFFATTPVVYDAPVSLLHTFNELPIGIRPYVVSFENELPRYLGDPPRWQILFGMGRLASRRCRAILALSEAAARGFHATLATFDRRQLQAKVRVFRGCVAEPGTPRQGYTPGGQPLQLLFVGRDAFGKGLPATLDAADELLRRGIDHRITIVCNFEPRSYICKHRAPDQRALRERMARMQNVVHHDAVPNAQVMAMMRTHDVLLFPTLDESLGWVAVEAGLAAMPVLTTDIFALPEIVEDGRTGYTIPLRKADDGRWLGLYLDGAEFDDEVDRMRTETAGALTERITALARDRELVASLGASARRKMVQMYGREHARAELATIYSAALA